MAQPGTIYRAWQNGSWNHPTLPPIIPDDTPQPPLPTDLWFGTTIYGSSYFNYKNHVLSGANGGAARYRQVEYDTVWNGNRGNAISRNFNTGGIGTYANMASSSHRAGQVICHSYKDGSGVNGSNETQFKNALKTWIDGHTGSQRCYLVFHHEFDNDGNMGNGNLHTGEMGNWYDRHQWTAEVMTDERPDDWARNGGWLKVGMITVGTVFTVGPTENRGYKTYCENMMSHAGVSELSDIWDFLGVDKYNPGWDKKGGGVYLPYADWSKRMIPANDDYGLPIVVGETGSPFRNGSQSLSATARKQERAAWLDAQWGSCKEQGIFDAVMYWRVPSNGSPLNAWSSNMATPDGYNTTVPGYSGSDVAAQGGFDDQYTSDVISEYCVNSITEANALGIGSTLTYWTGGPA